jgi:hypothetical protein
VDDKPRKIIIILKVKLPELESHALDKNLLYLVVLIEDVFQT